METGTYTVRLTITDQDGAATQEAVHTIEVQIFAVQTNATGERTLVVGGSTGDDNITVKAGDDSDSIKVKIKEKEYHVKLRETFEPPIDRIVVLGQAGNDRIEVAANLSIDTELHGDAGDDELKGGSGNDVLVGGAGDDKLDGGKGRDVLIGGSGKDEIKGSQDDDLLIAGSTSYDEHVSALNLLLTEWSSSRSYTVAGQ